MSEAAAQVLGVIPIAVGIGRSVAANTIAYANELYQSGERQETPCERALFDMLQLVVNLGGAACLVIYYTLGYSVPLGTAIAMAANMLTTMFLQQVLGLSRYTRMSQLGILTLVVSVYIMAAAGPTPRGDDVDAGAAFAKTSSQAWCLGLIALGVVSIYGIHATWHRPNCSRRKTLPWVVLNSCFNVLTDQISSVCGLLSGWSLVAGGAAWLFVSAAQVPTIVKWPSNTNVAIYVPMQGCVQLGLNMLTGFFIWEDERRIINMPLYLSSSLISFVGIFMVSGEETEEALVGKANSMGVCLLEERDEE